MLNHKWMWLALVALCYSILACNGNGGSSGSYDPTVTALEVTPADASIAIGTTQYLLATGILSDSTHQDMTASATWSSSDEGIATISNGVATAKGVGVTTITVTLGSISFETTLTVTDAALVSIEVTPTNPDSALGTSQQFTATGTFSDNSTQDLTTAVTWNSSNPATATISNAAGSEGSASSVSVGTTTITATLDGVFGSTDLTVTNLTLVSIAITPSSPSIVDKSVLQLTATAIYSDGTLIDITAMGRWSTSGSSVVGVSNATGTMGLVSARKPGTETITVTFGGLSGTTTVTVTDAL